MAELTPIEIMNAAYDAEYALWEIWSDRRCGQFDFCRDGKILKASDDSRVQAESEFKAMRKDASMRAAILALEAAIRTGRSSIKIQEAGAEAYKRAGEDDVSVRALGPALAAMLLTIAAEEGESK